MSSSRRQEKPPRARNVHLMKIGVDLGGTKIEIAALSETGEELLRHRVPTPQGNYDATLASIVELVSFVEDGLAQRGSIGVGTPGALSSAGLLRNSNSVILNGKPLLRDLQNSLRREIRMENDANCFALSEATDGAGAGCSVVFGAILGTGVGGGLVVDARLVTGKNHIAGEWGHNPLPWSERDDRKTRPCYCGKHGCNETYLSGIALACDFERATGRTLSAGEIDEAASAGDSQARDALRRYGDRLAQALAQIVNVIDPDVIVLGGGLSNIPQLYEEVPASIERYAISRPLNIAVVRSAHGDSSGVRGAAQLWG